MTSKLTTFLQSYQTRCLCPNLDIMQYHKSGEILCSFGEDYVPMQEVKDYFQELFQLLDEIKESSE